MATAERDNTDDWVIEPGRRPATVLELEGRIDTAVRLAEAAEQAALEIGAASLEAAEQARNAAALAESASQASHAAARQVADHIASAPPPQPAPPSAPPAPPVAEPPTAIHVIPAPPAPEPVEEPTPVPPPVEAAAPEPSSAPPEPAPTPIVASPPPSASVAKVAARRPAQPDPFDERLTAFRERAERIMLRLQQLEGASEDASPVS
jgi:outer membrane biosynthesis protein TonB